MKYLWIFILLINLLLLILMGVDKRRARRHRWRIPERILFLLAFLFGSYGGMLGLLLFRHKTRHAKFVWGFAILMILQTAILIAAHHFRWL